LKQRQIPQLNQRAHIPLDVGLEIAVEKPAGLQALFVEPGEKPAADQVEGVARRLVAADLTQRKRPEGQHGHPARQRLADGLMVVQNTSQTFDFHNPHHSNTACRKHA
jgi:hypothetical protein